MTSQVFILILLIYSGGPPVVIQQEFESEANCMIAKGAIMVELQTSSTLKPQIVGTCVFK